MGADLDTDQRYADCAVDGKALRLRTDFPRVSPLSRVLHYPVTGDLDGWPRGLHLQYLFYPVSAEALVNRAIGRYRAGYYISAIEDLDQALNFNPVSADAFYARGRIYLLLRRPRQAVRAL